MDICESKIKMDTCRRHPWERARFEFICRQLNSFLKEEKPIRVLDIGCGDLYIAKQLKKRFKNFEYIGVDTAIDCVDNEDDICVVNSWDYIPERKYDIIFLLDVLEHVEDDIGMLIDIREKFMNSESRLFITVPFHEYLFLKHDVLLGHVRRYSSSSLQSTIAASGNEVIRMRQFFFLPFLVRLLQKGVALLTKNKFYSKTQVTGLSSWSFGRLFTRCLTNILILDTKVFFSIPGLSGFAVCKKK